VAILRRIFAREGVLAAEEDEPRLASGP
jgi:hypothetical protein